MVLLYLQSLLNHFYSLVLKNKGLSQDFCALHRLINLLFVVQDNILTWLILKCWGLTNRTRRVRRPSPPLSLGRCPWLPHWPPSPPRPPPLPHLPVLQLRSSQRRWERRRRPHPARPSSGCWGGGLLRYYGRDHAAAQLLPDSNRPPRVAIH